jgi:predicted MFS family arabinose efflux permease
MKEQKTELPKKSNGKINLFTYKPFISLALPNVMRGFALGIASMGITIGYYTELIDGVSANYVIIMTNALSIVGSFAFSKIARLVRDKHVIFICSLVIAILLPLMTLAGTNLFIVIYGVLYLFLVILNNAVPVTVTKIIDPEVAGQYSGGRMLLNTLGTSLAGFVCVPMFRAIGVVPTLVISGLMQIVSGLGYYIVLIGIEKKKKAEGAVV